MTWLEVAEIQKLSAARLMQDRSGDFSRPVCSRAYYAAYALVTHRLLPTKITFAHGWNNPPHAQLTTYVNQIANLPTLNRVEVRRALRRLRQRREDADYRPGQTVDRKSARESFRDLQVVFAVLMSR